MRKLIWNNEKEFANAIKNLLLYKGFKIDSYYDDIGPDGGRDIEAHTFEYDTALDEYDSIKWWIELKYRSKSSLGARDIEDIRSKIVRAVQKKVDKFLLVTNTQYTPEFKDNISSLCKENNIKIRYWDISTLEKLFYKRENEASINDYRENLISDRLTETKLIFNTMQSELKTVFLLIGSAGVGKSALARYILRYMANSKGYVGGILDLQLQGGFGLQLKLLAENFKKQNSLSNFSLSCDIQKSEHERLELLFNHCLSNKTILVVDNIEKQLDINGKITNKYIQELINKFLNHNMNGSILLLLSRIPLNEVYSTNALFFMYELKGWDIDFVYEKYLPYLQYLNTSISNISDMGKKKELLETMEGNPLALKIADRLCISNNFEDIVNCIGERSNPAQSLIKLISEDLDETEIRALNKFAQFNRPMSQKEIVKYICSKEILNNLRVRKLVEPTTFSCEQYSMHPLIVAQFDLQNEKNRRKDITLEVTDAISKDLKGKNAEEIYNHGLLRQAAEMLLNIGEINRSAEIIIQIGTRALSMGDVLYLTNIIKRIKSFSCLSAINRTRLKKAEGHIHDFNGRYDLAQNTYKQMLTESIELKDAWSRAAALNGLGSISRFRNKCEEAISLYTESLQIRIDNNFIIDQSNSYHNLGAVYIIMEEYDKAIECLEKAKEIRERLTDIFRLSATELYLGECYIHIKNYKKAYCLLSECITNKKTVRDIIGYIWAHLAMSKLIICENLENYSRDKLEKSIGTLEHIAQICTEISHVKEYVISQIFMAICSLLLNSDTGTSLEYLVKARTRVSDTLLSDLYADIIKKLMNMAMSGSVSDDDISIIEQLAIKIKI